MRRLFIAIAVCRRMRFSRFGIILKLSTVPEGVTNLSCLRICLLQRQRLLGLSWSARGLSTLCSDLLIHSENERRQLKLVRAVVARAVATFPAWWAPAARQTVSPGLKQNSEVGPFLQTLRQPQKMGLPEILISMVTFRWPLDR